MGRRPRPRGAPGVMPAFLPVHEIPIAQIFYKSLCPHMSVIVFQYRVHIGTVLFQQAGISGTFIILQQHKNIVK